MASPQTKDGYTMVANEILDHIIQAPFSGSQFRIVMAVWRNTYGYHRKDHEMSVDFIAEATRLNPRVVKRELKKLIEMLVVEVVSPVKGVKPRTISFNKDYEKWQIEEAGSADPKPKEYEASSPPYKAAIYFHSRVMEHAAANKVGHLVEGADLQKWADEFRKIMDIDKRDKRELVDVIDWCTADSFWQVNILSPSKLRQKYVQLAVKMKTSPANRRSSGHTRDDRNKALLQKKMEEATQLEQAGDAEATLFDYDGLPGAGADRGED